MQSHSYVSETPKNALIRLAFSRCDEITKYNIQHVIERVICADIPLDEVPATTRGILVWLCYDANIIDSIYHQLSSEIKDIVLHLNMQLYGRNSLTVDNNATTVIPKNKTITFKHGNYVFTKSLP